MKYSKRHMRVFIIVNYHITIAHVFLCWSDIEDREKHKIPHSSKLAMLLEVLCFVSAYLTSIRDDNCECIYYFETIRSEMYYCISSSGR